MLNDLTQRMEQIIKRLKGEGKLSEENIKETLREIRRALLEADVNFKVVKDFVNTVQEKAIGAEVMKSLTPGQQLVKIVHQELIELMGSEKIDYKIYDNRITKIMVVGLQGSGKTTFCVKLANYLRKKNAKPVLAACDIYRPAAVDQLKSLGKQLDIPVIHDDSNKVNLIADKALDYADKNFKNLIILDTAGRMHLDQEMMEEVVKLKEQVKPDYIFFVADSMTGQDAVNVAAEFNRQLEFTGVVLTKMDGDTRGGAALSIKAVTNKPILFVGTGEKPSDLEEFHSERMASRILGMGDILSLIEKAEAAIDMEQAEKMQQRLKKNLFTLNDFYDQLQQIKKMGPLDQILKMIPGVNSKVLSQVDVSDKDTARIEAIISSMTMKERENPTIINGSRRRRIAAGSGTDIQSVNRLLKQYDQMKNMIKQMNQGKFKRAGFGL
ncbi:MAG: signal recognition particle protein [Candidatus Cloacimonas sp.]|jgi:signal recognition particle subunit SRP54|nr:signal recognition particle protein [Candidatus Cloacimonadota bacterium]